MCDTSKQLSANEFIASWIKNLLSFIYSVFGLILSNIHQNPLQYYTIS